MLIWVPFARQQNGGLENCLGLSPLTASSGKARSSPQIPWLTAGVLPATLRCICGHCEQNSDLCHCPLPSGKMLSARREWEILFEKELRQWKQRRKKFNRKKKKKKNSTEFPANRQQPLINCLLPRGLREVSSMVLPREHWIVECFRPLDLHLDSPLPEQITSLLCFGCSPIVGEKKTNH